MYKCKIVANSISRAGKGITTDEITFPRSVLAELRTHRLLTDDDQAITIYSGTDEAGRSISMNSASSRAIPIERIIKMVEEDPYIPDFTGAQSGMQGVDRSDDEQWQRAMQRAWLEARNDALRHAAFLRDNGVHKQDANRILEPWMWHTVVVTATDWENWFALRCHKDAHPAIRKIAEMMKKAHAKSTPRVLQPGEWSLPYITEENRYDAEQYIKHHSEMYPRDFQAGVTLLLCKMSAARCGRISYLRQSSAKEIDEDLQTFSKFAESNPKHASPLEHQATPLEDPTQQIGNFFGWMQFRHTLENESVKG